MILQDLGEVLEPAAKFAGFFMLSLGVMWLIFCLYEGFRRKSFKDKSVKDWDFKMTKFLKALTFLGFLVGLLCIIVGVVGFLRKDVPPSAAYGELYENKVNYFTSILLVIIGVITFIKPANDMPIATVLALIAASAVTIIIAIIIPESGYVIAEEITTVRVVLIILFVIIFVISALVVKFFSKGFMTASKALSWPPLAIIISILCLLQGLLIIAGYSLIYY